MTKTFLQYGAGNIGRGFLGQIFSQAGYEVCFVDISEEIIQALNKERRYPINIVSTAKSERIWVENVRGVLASDIPGVKNEIAQAELMAVAVGVNALPKIVPLLSEGLKHRWQKGNMQPLNIMICENLVAADQYLSSLLKETFNAEEKELFLAKTGLIEVSIGRMVPLTTEAMKKDNVLRVDVESYCELPVDAHAFLGEIPDVPHLHPVAPFEYYIRRKLFLHNMGHSLLAYLGSLYNYHYIWEAMQNPYLKLMVERAMLESALALAHSHRVPFREIQLHLFDLLFRFANKGLGDTVLRVGKDTARKLSAEDRFCGAIKLCQSSAISPVYISLGVAAGLRFQDDSQGTRDLRRMVQEKGLEKVLEKVCGLDRNEESWEYTTNYYRLFVNNCSLEKILSQAEHYHQQVLQSKQII